MPRGRTPKQATRLTPEQLYALLPRTDKEIADYIRRLAKQGRPPNALDPTRVMQLRAVGCSMDECAAELGISPRAFQNRVAKDPVVRRMFDEGDLKGKAQLRSAQHMKAVIARDSTMLIWLGKNRLGQRDQFEIGGSTDADVNPAGAPVRFTLSADQAAIVGQRLRDAP